MSWRKYCDKDAWHEASNLFPMLPEDDAVELARDIAAHGLQNPIILFEDKVLDGRNRLLACKAANVAPHFKQWHPNGASPVAFVITQNLRRRHLNASQRAAITVKALPLFVAEAKHRQRHHGGTAPGKSKNKNTSRIIAGSESKGALPAA